MVLHPKIHLIHSSKVYTLYTGRQSGTGIVGEAGTRQYKGRFQEEESVVGRQKVRMAEEVAEAQGRENRQAPTTQHQNNKFQAAVSRTQA
jgi:hypothetical protein